MVFTPEFLRKGKVLYDNLFPNRITVGYPQEDEELADQAETIHFVIRAGLERDCKVEKNTFCGDEGSVEPTKGPQHDISRKHAESGDFPYKVLHQVADLSRRERDGKQILYILCPCYNEEESLEKHTAVRLGELMEEMVERQYCSPLSRICFINDGSVDGTPQILKKLHRQDPRFCYINLSNNFGHQNALLCGLLETRGLADVTISIDCDLQQDPYAMLLFLDKYYEGYDIVYGVRKSRGTDRRFKRLSASAYYMLMEFLLGTSVIRNHSDYRLMSRRSVNALAAYNESNLYLRGLVPTMGYNSCIVYHEVEERRYGESKYSLRKMLALAEDGITSFSARPMTIILGVGFFVSVVSFLVIAVYLIAYLCGTVVSGWTSLILSVWLLGGLLMMSIGCLGEYLGKQYMETKHRPRYIVESFVNTAYRRDGEDGE